MKKILIALGLAALSLPGLALPASPLSTTPATDRFEVPLVEPHQVALPAVPDPETFPTSRIWKTVKCLQLGPQSGIVKVLGTNKKVLWTRGFDDQKLARLDRQQHGAIFAALEVPEQQMASLSQQLMDRYPKLPHAQTVALLGALALEPALTRAEQGNIEEWLNRLLSLETKDVVTRRQALLALALLPEASDATVATMLKTYETSGNLWETFPIGQFVQYHAIELLQRPDGARIRQRLTKVGSIYTPVMLEELVQQEPPQATPVLDNLH